MKSDADLIIVQYPSQLAQIRKDQTEEMERKRMQSSDTFPTPSHGDSARAVKVN